MNPQNLTLLGATGSIGRSTLDVLRAHPERWRLHAAACGRQVEALARIAGEFHPAYAAVADERLLGALREALDAAGAQSTKALAGPQTMIDLAADPETDGVLQAIVGAAGVAPTFAAAKAGKRLMLANKESVVCGGALLMEAVRASGAKLLPVDSEHSAVFQCLEGASEQSRRAAKIILTASGGPFRGRKDLSGITPEMAVKHPKWSMGRKISIDSASLMNKGLEVIEASWLFGFPGERIGVVVHPESIVHSMVEFEDGAVLAQLGMPDMKTPIAYAMGWPERLDGGSPKLDLAALGRLTFEAPDLETFPLLRLAYEALAAGGGRTIVLNAANEVAVEAFCERELGFTEMFSVVASITEGFAAPAPGSVEEILAIDAEARAKTREFIAARRAKQGS